MLGNVLLFEFYVMFSMYVCEILYWEATDGNNERLNESEVQRRIEGGQGWSKEISKNDVIYGIPAFELSFVFWEI